MEPNDLTPAQKQAYDFVEQMVPRADHQGPYPMWYGWALREAYQVGWRAAVEECADMAHVATQRGENLDEIELACKIVAWETEKAIRRLKSEVKT